MKIRNCDMYSFMERLGDKKIIAFGQGLQLSSMINMYEPPKGWESVIKYVVDNDKYLWNEEFKIKNFSFKIYSPEVLRKEEPQENVVVIFGWSCYAIISQLNAMREIDDMDCFFFPLMQTYTIVDQGNFRTSLSTPVIPKKIHYCWFGGNPLTESAQKCIDSWRKYCPDYEIICWNENNYDVSKHPYMYEAYKNKAWAFVSDYARLDILYEHGGIYMDTDVEVRKCLDPLLYNEAYCGFSSHLPRINTGVGLGSIKGMPLLKEMMEIYRFERYETDNGFNKTLCQLYNTKALVYHGLVQNGQYQVVKGMACYPKDYLDPMSSRFYVAPRDERAFSVHLSSNSWSEFDVRFKKIKQDSKTEILKYLEMVEE